MEYKEEFEGSDKFSDSRISMCDGLLECSALTSSDNKKVYASIVNKSDGPFYCPECLSDVIVRKCVEKADHFAHKARLSSVYTSKESKLHYECKHEIVNTLRELLPEGNWEVERPIEANKSKGYKALRPDISGRINGKPIVIEVQKSTMDINKIKDRTEQYTKRGAFILWIVPLKYELGNQSFRPRLFEKYLHSMYFGRIYYWIKGMGIDFMPVHFDRAQRWIEQSFWYEAGNPEEQVGGGYFKDYKTIKKPLYTLKKLNLIDDFVGVNARNWKPKTENFEIPVRKIFMDKEKKWWNTNSYLNE